MEYGIQMFGINSIFLNDKEKALSVFKKAGLTILEPCYNLAGLEEFKYNAWTEEDFDINRPLLEKYGLKIISVHLFYNDLDEDTAKLIEVAKKHNIKQYVISVPDISERDACEAFVKEISEAGTILKESGVELLLHNCGNECVRRLDDISIYEWILNRVKGIVGAQPDTGWLFFGGVDPVSFLNRNKDQIKSLHHKDMTNAAGSDDLHEIGIGKGLVDMKGCYEFARSMGLNQIMDQDKSDDDFLEDVAFVGNIFKELEA